MKNLVFASIFTVLFVIHSFGQPTKQTNAASSLSPVKTTETFGPWLFIESDKALQVRFSLVKTENDIGYFKIQFRIDFQDKIYCDDPNCEGYLLYFSYPSLDNQKQIGTSYKFYNSFKGVYTKDELVPIKMKFPDGSSRIFKNGLFFYKLSTDGNEEPMYNLFYNCVDNIWINRPYQKNRCLERRRDYNEEQAIIIR